MKKTIIEKTLNNEVFINPNSHKVKSSLKIAIVCDRVYPFFKGGVEKRYWDIAEKLIKKGHEVHFYTGQWPGMEKEMILNNIHLHGVYKVKNFYVNGKKSIK